jgi:ferritin-like protein
MSPELTIEQLDQDGALSEALAGVYGDSRTDFLRKAALGGAALLGALALPAEAAAKTSDTALLNFDLTFEYLQSTFYTEAERIGTIAKMRPEKAFWAKTLGAHERAHVAVLKKVLGRDAVRSPAFNFRGATESDTKFTKTAVAMEDVTVALLTGQTARIKSRGLVSALFSLLTVEARHAAWARHIVGAVPVAKSVDVSLPVREVDRIVDSTRFIVSRPRLSTRRRPRFTG